MLWDPTTHNPNMSPPQIFDHPGIYSQDSLANLVANNVPMQGYAPNSCAFDSSFLSQYPSNSGDAQSWPQVAKVLTPPNSMAQYAMQPQPAPIQQYQDPFKNSTRPRSSPSTFGPTSESIQWPIANGLGIYPNSVLGQLTPPVTSTFAPNVFETFATDDRYVKGENYLRDDSSALGTPEIRQPQPQRPYVNIQPDPSGVAAQKRSRDDEDQSELGLSTKRRKRTSSVASADLSEDDRLLVSLKEDQNLPWKDIASRYSAEKGKTVQVAALQMKYKRLREKHRPWTERDLSALRQAHEMWEKRKWEIISEKMLEFGIEERWNPKQCASKFRELEMVGAMMTTTAGMTPAMSHFSTSQFSSPIDAPPHYGFMPLA